MKPCRRLTLALILAVGALAFVLWPRGPRLELYTSPPLTIQGQTARLQALVPAGWKASIADDIPIEISGPLSDRAAVLASYPRFRAVRFTPPKRGAWLPGWLRRHLYGPDEPVAELQFTYGPGPYDPPRGETRIHVSRKTGTPIYCALRAPSGAGGFLSYTRGDEAEFDATRPAICQSFKVLQSKGNAK